MSKTAAVIKGDGVGPELVDAMLKVTEAAGTDVELSCVKQEPAGGKNTEVIPLFRMKPGKSLIVLMPALKVRQPRPEE